jgi:hypothetical protein
VTSSSRKRLSVSQPSRFGMLMSLGSIGWPRGPSDSRGPVLGRDGLKAKKIQRLGYDHPNLGVSSIARTLRTDLPRDPARHGTIHSARTCACVCGHLSVANVSVFRGRVFVRQATARGRPARHRRCVLNAPLSPEPRIITTGPRLKRFRGLGLSA